MKAGRARVVELKLEPLPGGSSTRLRVKTSQGVLLGFLEKLPPAPGEKHPWKAFRPQFVAGSPAQFGEMIFASYHGQLGAIGALVGAEYGAGCALKILE